MAYSENMLRIEVADRKAEGDLGQRLLTCGGEPEPLPHPQVVFSFKIAISEMMYPFSRAFTGRSQLKTFLADCTSASSTVQSLHIELQHKCAVNHSQHDGVA